MQQKNPEADAILKAVQQREKDHLLQLTICNLLNQVTNLTGLHAIVQQLNEVTLADNFEICVTDAHEKEYRLFFSYDKTLQEAKNTFYNTTDGIFNTALQSAEPVVYNAATLSKKKTAHPFLEHSFKAGIREVVALPLHYQKNNPSVVFLLYKRAGGFNRDAYRLLKGISMQMSLTISNILFTQKIKLHSVLPIIAAKYEPLQETKTETDESEDYNSIIGQGTAMQSVIRLVKQVTPSESGVLLLGESGTGKEVIASAIHKNSNNKNKDMVRVNCAAIPANLIESELFGHEKGSFTGATERRIGKFEQANNSTLFLDEIGELPLALQTKLLRVLQENEFERIGSTATIKVNVRIIAATNRNLKDEVAKGKFRADLFYRLNVFPIELPPLRKRKEDIESLSEHFIERFCAKTGRQKLVLSPKVLRTLTIYTWPGNVRELKHTLERSILLTESKGKTITKIYLPEINDNSDISRDGDHYIKRLDEVEKEHILKVIKLCDGRISGPNGAALKLGIPSTTLLSKMQKLGILKSHAFKSDI
jgi:formate hydrogenlyase transcriptional activator